MDQELHGECLKAVVDKGSVLGTHSGLALDDRTELCEAAP